MERHERASAWYSMAREMCAETLTKAGLGRLRRAAKTLAIPEDDVIDIESAIGYRSEDLAALYGKWQSVSKYRAPKC